MSDPFQRSIALMGNDSPHRIRAGWGTAVVFIAAWLVWFFTADIPLVVTSSNGTTEVAASVYVLQAPVGGQVVRVFAKMGDSVEAGDRIVELTADAEQLEQREAEVGARSAALSAQRLREEIALETFSLERSRQAATAALNELVARSNELGEHYKAALADAKRGESLHASGLVSKSDLDRLRSEVERQRQAALAQQAAIDRLKAEMLRDEASRSANLKRLGSQLALTEGEVGGAGVAMRRLQHEIELRTVRASTSGLIAEEVRVQEGSTVKVGDRLTSILPNGRLRLVADFASVDALGKIRPGQNARARLHGFSSAEYFVLHGTVRRVGAQPVDGRVRVEIELAPTAGNVPLKHGMAATTEVDLHSETPWEFVLRSVGKRLDGIENSSGAQR